MQPKPLERSCRRRRPEAGYSGSRETVEVKQAQKSGRTAREVVAQSQLLLTACRRLGLPERVGDEAGGRSTAKRADRAASDRSKSLSREYSR